MTYRSIAGSAIARFAAATALTAAAAFASDFHMEGARIPFAFRAGGVQMPAGSYRVMRQPSRPAPVFFLTHLETKKAIAVMMPVEVSPDKTLDGSQARMVFQCAGTDCVLSEVQPGQGRNGFKSPVKFRGQETARVEVGYRASE